MSMPDMLKPKHGDYFINKHTNKMYTVVGINKNRPPSNKWRVHLKEVEKGTDMYVKCGNLERNYELSEAAKILYSNNKSFSVNHSLDTRLFYGHSNPFWASFVGTFIAVDKK